MRIPVLLIIFGSLLIVSTDAYIFFDIKQFTNKRHRKAACWVWAVFCLLCWALLIVGLSLPKRSPSVDILPQIWMLFTVITIYVAKIAYCLCSVVGRIFCRRGLKYRGAYIGVPVAFIVLIAPWWGVLFTRNDIQTNRVEISSEKLPESFNGFKVLQFSDAHVGTWGTDTLFVSRLVDSINAQKPDLILFTGDIVNRQSRELDPFLPVLSRLNAPYGVYSVHGNHDYAGYVTWPHPGDANKDVARLDSLQKSIGWKVLNNQTAYVRNGSDSIAVIGVENWGEPPFVKLGDLNVSHPDGKVGLNDGNFKILLTHNPNHWSQVVTKASNIDLTLSGHTHAMQMMLKAGDWKWSPSKFHYPQYSGLFTDTAKDGTPMDLYVNIGVGEVGFPARIGAAKPELTLITLKKGGKPNPQSTTK